MSRKLDYIIIGQGLAGSCLYWQLASLGCSVFVVDKPHKFSASRVAAGTANPMTFRRVLKSWNADTLLQVAQTFYSRIATELNTTLLTDMPVYKVFATPEEQPLWEERMQDADAGRYLELPNPADMAHLALNQPFGGGLVRGSFWLNVANFLAGTRAQLMEKQCFAEAEITPQHLDFGDSVGMIVNGELIEAKHVIFCNGAAAARNPFFDWLPFKLVKGEVLTIEAPALQLDTIAHRQCFVLPLGNQRFRVGSTYEWDELDELPTEAGKKVITERLERLITVPYHIIDHVAGIRPTIRDRRPFIGQHPANERLWLLSGLGAKGVLQAPWCAHILAQRLVHNTPLPDTVNIARHAAQYSDVREVVGSPLNASRATH